MADAITLLETDHREVEELFTKAESISGAAQGQVVTKIASELTVHAEIEETVMYPAMRDAGLEDLVDEAEEEHATVKQLVAKLEAVDPASPDVAPILSELKSNVEHHVEEEEGEAFPKFRKVVDQGTLNRLGDALAQAKKRAGGGS